MVGAGLLLTGVFSVAIAETAWLPGTAWLPILVLALFVASIGNPIYAVANQTALIEAAEPAIRGSVMATRFGIVQTSTVIGIGVGGILTAQFHASGAYLVLGVGLVILALYALAAGRSTVNPLHGAAYEEAALQRAKT
jgi:MFS family permease